MLLYPYIRMNFGGDLTVMLLFFTTCYLMIQYLLCPLIKKLTVHRGIMHSIPFALLCGQITFLLFTQLADTVVMVARYCAIAVTMGALTHLLLDEFHSISFKGSRPKFKRSSGTALALYSSNVGATLFVYLLLLSASYLIFADRFDQSLAQLFAYIISAGNFHF